jgi:hypothetical protein
MVSAHGLQPFLMDEDGQHETTSAPTLPRRSGWRRPAIRSRRSPRPTSPQRKHTPARRTTTSLPQRRAWASTSSVRTGPGSRVHSVTQDGHHCSRGSSGACLCGRYGIQPPIRRATRNPGRHIEPLLALLVILAVIPPDPTAANQTALNGMPSQPELPRPYWTGLSGRLAVTEPFTSKLTLR